MSGDSEKQCPFSADFGDILLPVIRYRTKIRIENLKKKNWNWKI
jgi:hypothetical protein